MLATLSVRVGHAFGAEDPGEVARTLRGGLGYGLLVGILGCLAMLVTLPLVQWLGVPLPDVALLTPYWQAMAAQGRGETARIRAIGSATFASVTAWMLVATVLLALFGRRIAEAMSDDPQDYRWPVGVTLLSYWLLALPMSYWLAFHSALGPVGVWVGFACGLAVSAVLLPWRFYRLQARPLTAALVQP
ncbi:hypothetical protein WR25_08955 [Diploscapter pachys]|uniref:Uncharacterized protein n=1 Tax=Diploscapter pachys TaxID=2018661 RepID=A0A2A2KEM4_9BILA|nr:hypothetical protein WR25_08955 [Diploscapter pachys]